MVFKKREENIGIFFVGGHRPWPQKVRIGDSVILKTGEIQVLIRNIDLVADDHFSGEVYGFEGTNTDEVNGVHKGEIVNFEQKNIISCGYK